MRLHNRHGTPVDAVPFVVVTALGVMLCFSYGPIYLMEFGVPLREALAVSALAAVAIACGAYHRCVWTLVPERRDAVPATLRLRRLILAALVAVAFLTLLSLPMFAN